MKYFVKKLLITTTFACISYLGFASEIYRVEPPFWWTGMKNTELQIMFYGDKVANAELQFAYDGVELIKAVKVDNPNYIFVYLNISENAKAGQINFNFTENKKSFTYTYELRKREKTTGAQGFNSSDVLYLIMPDRFANGDVSNDVWDDEPVDRNDQYGRHGGDFAGINQHLDYINNLGMTTIWLNPVFENKMHKTGYQSYHGYATTDFYRVDKRFGSNDDYCALIENIHNKGMKIVMDMIYNHCGSLHWWMNDLPCSDWLNHQSGFVQSSHNLYTILDLHAPQSEVKALVDGWFVDAMPDMNQRNPHLAKYLIQNSIWWIEYSRIDGIRHDTHPYLDFDFLSQWCKAVNDEYPDFNIVGELCYDNPSALAWWQKNSKLNDRQSNLLTVMDFALLDACLQTFTAEPEKDFSFKKIYETLAQDFMYADLNNILTFLDNHDRSRFMKKDETDLRRYKQALAFILTTRGIPQIYYGTEILMHGEKHEGDGLLRKDFPGGWQDDAANAFTEAGRTDLQNEAWNYLQKLLQWRKKNHAVCEGKLIHYAPESDIYVYFRIKNDNKVMIILNGANSEKTLLMNKYNEIIGNSTSGKEIFSGQILDINEKLNIPAKGTYIIEIIN
ncbi:MAG: glycoside hydrolase family 13 protein [Prevotellaceae bacterium]|jgi:glycosidase|nr:glycoside hydrolase family 13 protein [Prevotellaceae bacterium]